MSRIESRALRDVAFHWNAARGDRRLPGWSQIDPIAIAKHLPIIWSWRYDRATAAFVGRLSGNEIDTIFGKSLRGRPMRDFFEDWEYDKIYARHHRVATEPCFAHGTGAVFIHANRYGAGERIIMPLADDGENGDGIIGATVYRMYERDRTDADKPLDEHVAYEPA